jgi:phenylacetate-coenzyme A ligase PaaK-like adenylate-forming protein
VLPVTNEKTLMSRFDEWVTDRAVTLNEVRTFIADSARIGEHFPGGYTALTTSGTSGMPGVFLWDDRTMTVVNVLMLRALRDWIRMRDVLKLVTHGGRMTLICATGGHYAEPVAGARL